MPWGSIRKQTFNKNNKLNVVTLARQGPNQIIFLQKIYLYSSYDKHLTMNDIPILQATNFDAMVNNGVDESKILDVKFFPNIFLDEIIRGRRWFYGCVPCVWDGCFSCFPLRACVHTPRENIHPCATWSHFLSQVGQGKKINLDQAPLEEGELSTWFLKELGYTYLGKTSMKVAFDLNFLKGCTMEEWTLNFSSTISKFSLSV